METNESGSEGDTDLEADVNSLPNLNEFIRPDILHILYQTREWKLQTTINELIHTERTHLKSLKIMKKCFREPMERFPGMSPVELDCIFRNLDQLIHLHSEIDLMTIRSTFVFLRGQFKVALRQHRDDAPEHVVRNIGDVILRFVSSISSFDLSSKFSAFSSTETKANSSLGPVRFLSKINLKR